MRWHSKRFVWQLAFWVTWTVCTVLLLLPASELPTLDLWDKAEHAIAFAALMLLLLPAHAHQQPVHRLALALLMYGITVEGIQHVVPDRSFSMADMLADAVGIGVALALNIPLQLQRRVTP